jgi:hypothetical protein
MHLIESQATQVGQFIDEPQLYEKYFPLSFNDKYIVFAPFSKNSKNYDFWQDCLSILLPELNKNNIKILQIGAQNERPFGGCVHLMGQTSINQVVYLIKNSIGVLSTDTFAQHIADAYNVKSVVLISNNYSVNVKGYFNPQNQTVIEPIRESGEKPCLALDEVPKSINRIKPEQIAQAVSKMLNLEYNFPYQTIYTGEISLANMVISTCDSVIDPRQLGIDSLIIDLSINFNEQILAQQLQVCPCSILTNRPINLDIIKNLRPRVKELVYIIESLEFSNPDFVKEIQKLGINVKVISTLSQEEINRLKIDWMETSIIFPKPTFPLENIKEIKDEDKSKLFYKSAKFYLGRSKLYGSKNDYTLDKPLNNFDEIVPITDNSLWYNEIDSFRVLKKTV